MDYRIRQVRQGDELILAYIQVESWKAAFQDILPEEVLKKYTDIEHVTNIYRKLLEENKGNGYILEIDGKAHCIAYWDAAREKDMPDTAEIICIHILQNNWRKGYGSKMMERLLTDIAVSGYSKVMLWVFEANERARSFYEANGFSATERTQPAFGSSEICYEKSLLSNLPKLHTTELGATRIKRNLGLNPVLNRIQVEDWCREKIGSPEAVVMQKGKNWYVEVDGCVITVNARSSTIITAHRPREHRQKN